MLRKIIEIDEKLCNGCSLCANACHEGAIVMVDKKAKLLRDDYCDGLGDCLPVCPTNAIKFVERDAKEYDKVAVKAAQAAKQIQPITCGCIGSHSKTIENKSVNSDEFKKSNLRQWPVQIKLINANADYLNGVELLIAADCCAYAYKDFHEDFIKNKITLIGCPKLDEGDYSEKLTKILKENDIKSVTVVRMEVPCCSGIENAVKVAVKNCGKIVPWHVSIITTDGQKREK